MTRKNSGTIMMIGGVCLIALMVAITKDIRIASLGLHVLASVGTFIGGIVLIAQGLNRVIL